MSKSKAVTTKKRADQYNDSKHNYREYWQGRDYEHAAEEVAIRRLLKGRHFRRAADIGGGFGRLSILLADYADEVTLAEPSQQQLDLAVDFLRDHQQIRRRLMQADNLEFEDESLDLITMVRVMHHIPHPEVEFRELARILAPDGYLILELANYAHIVNRLKHIVSRKKLPTDPVDIRSESNKNEQEIDFVNHNPKTVINQLAHAGLRVEKILSVSNLRSTRLKRALPTSAMITVEKNLQRPLAKLYFGPSIFFLVRKAR